MARPFLCVPSVFASTDGGEVIAKRKGVPVTQGLQKPWSKIGIWVAFRKRFEEPEDLLG